MQCTCAELGDFLSVWDGDQTFVEFTLVDDRIGLELRLCPACGTRWQVDIDRSNLAIRVPNSIEWADFDDRPFRLASMIDHHGGLSDELCCWANCSRRCLAGKAICAHHAYPGLSTELDTDR